MLYRSEEQDDRISYKCDPYYDDPTDGECDEHAVDESEHWEDTEEADDPIADLLYEIVTRMGFKGADIEWEEWPDHVRYYVEGKDLGALIGRHGSTLEALQYIVGVVNSHRKLVDHMIIVDIEGYRERREVNLRRLAKRSAELAIREGREVALEPMPSSDRRTIHMTLKSDPLVDTESEGDEPDRFVVIIPRSEKA